LLHDGEGVEIEPAHGGALTLDPSPIRWERGTEECGDGGGVFFGFEAGAKWRDAIFDEIEAGTLHDVVFVVVGGSDDFFGDTEGGADLRAREFAVLEELEISGGKPGGNDFVGAPEEEGAIGGAGAATAVAEGGADLLLLFIGEFLLGTDDAAGIGVVVHEAEHKGGSGEIGFGGERGDVERGETAPEIKRVGEAIEPDFFGEEDLGFEGRVVGGSVTPAEELVVLDDVLEVGRIEEQNIFDF